MQRTEPVTGYQEMRLEVARDANSINGTCRVEAANLEVSVR
jgi:hypothetical protein